MIMTHEEVIEWKAYSKANPGKTEKDWKLSKNAPKKTTKRVVKKTEKKEN